MFFGPFRFNEWSSSGCTGGRPGHRCVRGKFFALICPKKKISTRKTAKNKINYRNAFAISFAVTIVVPFEYLLWSNRPINSWESFRCRKRSFSFSSMRVSSTRSGFSRFGVKWRPFLSLIQFTKTRSLSLGYDVLRQDHWMRHVLQVHIYTRGLQTRQHVIRIWVWNLLALGGMLQGLWLLPTTTGGFLLQHS